MDLHRDSPVPGVRIVRGEWREMEGGGGKTGRKEDFLRTLSIPPPPSMWFPARLSKSCPH